MDHAQRQVLPASAAVKVQRFTTADHERSRIVREVMDSWDVPLTPRPVADAPCESIIMEVRKFGAPCAPAAHVVRQNTTAALELDNTPAPLAFEVVADESLRDAAGQALAQINNRKARPRKTAPKSWIARFFLRQ